MDCETAFEALREIQANGPHRWCAAELLVAEIQACSELRTGERSRLVRFLQGLNKSSDAQHHRLGALIERRLMRLPAYRQHIVYRVTQRLRN